MIEILDGLPDNVVGIVAKGRVTKTDCVEVLLPAIDRAREWHHRLRLYYELRSRYPGAAWEEITLAAEGGGPHWERVAIVTDAAWVRHTIQAVRLLIPSEIRVFATSQTPEGLAWITGAPALRKQPRAPLAGTAHPRGAGRVFVPPVQYLHHAP